MNRTQLVVVGACGLIAGCGGSTKTVTETQTVTQVQQARGPSAAVAKKWPRQWCKTQIGMTRDQMRDLMGKPTEEYTADTVPAGYEPSMSWEAFQYHFTAYFAMNDKVRQLDYTELPAEEHGKLDCAISRT